MTIKCKSGKKPRYGFREIGKGKKQRLAFCGKKEVIEIVTFKKGKKIKVRGKR